jgi:hypothetical protein
VDLSLKSLVKLLIQKWDNSQDMLSIQFSNVECKAKRKILLYISLMSKLELRLFASTQDSLIKRDRTESY